MVVEAGIIRASPFPLRGRRRYAPALSRHSNYCPTSNSPQDKLKPHPLKLTAVKSVVELSCTVRDSHPGSHHNSHQRLILMTCFTRARLLGLFSSDPLPPRALPSLRVSYPWSQGPASRQKSSRPHRKRQR